MNVDHSASFSFCLAVYANDQTQVDTPILFNINQHLCLHQDSIYLDRFEDHRGKKYVELWSQTSLAYKGFLWGEGIKIGADVYSN